MKRSNMRDSRPEDITKIRLEKRKNEYDEYLVKVWIKGVYSENASYLTDDWQDAIYTFEAIAKTTKLKVTKNGNTHIADSECETWDEVIEEIKIKDAIEDYKAKDAMSWQDVVGKFLVPNRDNGDIFYRVIGVDKDGYVNSESFRFDDGLHLTKGTSNNIGYESRFLKYPRDKYTIYNSFEEAKKIVLQRTKAMLSRKK